MAAKRKTLPKDFEELLKKGDLEELKALLEQCEPNARGGYGKHTALAFDDCPDELARWLVANGTDLSAGDTWGKTPLHERARSYRGRIDVLLELGADPNAPAGTYGTPLHSAAEGKQVENAAKLIAKGARPDELSPRGFTPLELALAGASNAELDRLAPLAKLLLGAGAQRTPRMKEWVARLGKQFETFRSAFAKEHVDATSAALDELYRLFDVAPAPRRQMHDGTSPIAVKATRWQQQHAELWDLLVPPKGAAPTVQGEVIRIAGRISREVLDNGSGNWDEQFSEMARAFLVHVQSGAALSEAELTAVRGIVGELTRRKTGDCARLTELGVAWVLRNLNPIPHGTPAYSR